jgi:ADP-ribose diphosphatase
MAGKINRTYKKLQSLPTISRCDLAAQSRLFKIEEIDLTFSNGVERTYERMKGSGRGAVMVVPCLNDKEFILVREYAAGVHGYELGFPKGLIDPGETPEQAANRELQEEIGYGAKSFTKITTVSTAPSYFSAQMHIFIATDLYEATLPGDEPEPLQKVVWGWNEADELLENDEFNEARSIAALLLAQKKMD